ncbi:hypothetical protein JCM17380_16270 [Desulfosporosinus burensis]
MSEHEQNHGEKKVYSIIVNAREKTVEAHKLTFEDVVILAYNEVSTDPNVTYSVSYSRGQSPETGSMVKGATVTLKQGMIFNVSKTDKS